MRIDSLKGRLEKKKKKVGTWKKICQMYARDTFSSSGKTFWSLEVQCIK